MPAPRLPLMCGPRAEPCPLPCCDHKHHPQAHPMLAIQLLKHPPSQHTHTPHGRSPSGLDPLAWHLERSGLLGGVPGRESESGHPGHCSPAFLEVLRWLLTPEPPLTSHSPFVLSGLSAASQDPCALPGTSNLQKIWSRKNQALLPLLAAHREGRPTSLQIHPPRRGDQGLKVAFLSGEGGEARSP